MSATSINNLLNFSRALPEPFDKLASKKLKVSSKYGSGTEATLCSTVIKAVHAMVDCMTGNGEGAVGIIDHRMVAEYKSSKGPDAYHLVVFDSAPEERKLQRLFRNGEATRLIKRCNDFGAGGVSVAIGELADGIEIDLNAVPKKYEGLDGTELAISESQERMAVVVEAKDVERFKELAELENLEATVVARVTELPRLVMRWNGNVIVDISREFLNSNGAEKHISVAVSAPQSFEKKIEGDFKSLMSCGVGVVLSSPFCR